MAGELGKREVVKVGAPIIKANGLAKRYISIDRGVVKAVDNVSLDVNEGEIFGLVGVSGGGKTTFSKMVSGIITPTAGSISVRVGDDWVDITVLGPTARPGHQIHRHPAPGVHALSISQRHREPDRGHRPLPALRAGGEQGHPHSGDGRVHGGAGGSGTGKMPDELSEGERHRVAMAQVLIKEPRIVILDEPTGTMDAITKIEVTKSILNAREELGETFVIVSHDMDFVKMSATGPCSCATESDLSPVFPIEVLAKITEEEEKEMLGS